MSTLNTKLSVLKKKAVEINVTEIAPPANIVDPLVAFASNSAPLAATANEWTVDVFPSQIPIIMYIMKVASAASALADHKDNAKSSLATFVMYYVTCFQALFLINDLFVRPHPSSHAASWSTVHWKKDFVDFLLNLPVPDSLFTIFAQLSASETDKTSNVFFVPTAAGFSLTHFFGRFVPINFFAHIHDCIATMPGNSKPADIWKDLLARQLFKFTFTDFTGKTNMTCSDILGIITEGTTANYHASKWYQLFTGIFNPVLFRDFHRRSSLATLDLNVPNFKSASKLNAYDILFSATPHNLAELQTVLQHVQGILTKTVPCSKTLATLISGSSGNAILHHGYSSFAIPTWSSNPDATNDLLPNITKLSAQDTETRVNKLKFLQTPTRPTAQTTITAATAGGHASAVIASLTYPWSLISTGTSTSPLPKDKEFVTYDEDNELDFTYPNVLVLDTVGTSTVSAHLATLTGKIIESFELDGTTIEIPHPDKALAQQNSLFADSAIPLSYVVRSSRFYGRTTDLPYPLKRAYYKTSSSQPASTLVHDRTKIRLPAIAGNGTPGEANIQDGTAMTQLPGFTTYGNTDWIKYAQSFFGFRTLSPADAATHDSLGTTEKGRFYVWSPYTYTSREDTDPSELTPDLTENRTYFLTNLRTLFGTDTNLVRVNHPFKAMPV